MNYKEFVDNKRSVSIKGINDFKLFGLLSNLERKLGELGIEEDVLFYPKGLFTEEGLTLYFFLDDQMLSVNFLDDFTYEIGSQQLKNITEVIIKYHTNSRLHRKLIIHINEKEIVFNSKEDTNASWAEKFSDRIEDIYKYLIMPQ